MDCIYIERERERVFIENRVRTYRIVGLYNPSGIGFFGFCYNPLQSELLLRAVAVGFCVIFSDSRPVSTRHKITAPPARVANDSQLTLFKQYAV